MGSDVLGGEQVGHKDVPVLVDGMTASISCSSRFYVSRLGNSEQAKARFEIPRGHLLRAKSPAHIKVGALPE